MLVDISGSDEQRQKAIEALNQMGVVVEEEAVV